MNAGIQRTANGREHLGAVIGSENFRSTYVNEPIDKWFEAVYKLAEITTEPHSACSAFTHGL